MWGHEGKEEEEEDACENFFSNALGTYAKGNNQVSDARFTI